MNALRAIKAELIGIGYRPEAVIRDYTFADVLSAHGEPRCIALAAFTLLVFWKTPAWLVVILTALGGWSLHAVAMS